MELGVMVSPVMGQAHPDRMKRIVQRVNAAGLEMRSSRRNAEARGQKEADGNSGQTDAQKRARVLCLILGQVMLLRSPQGSTQAMYL